MLSKGLAERTDRQEQAASVGLLFLQAAHAAMTARTATRLARQERHQLFMRRFLLVITDNSVRISTSILVAR